MLLVYCKDTIGFIYMNLSCSEFERLIIKDYIILIGCTFSLMNNLDIKFRNTIS